MSVRTSADEYLDAAKGNIQNAIVNLGRIVVDEVHGSDEFVSSFREDMREVYSQLIVLKDKLKGPQ